MKILDSPASTILVTNSEGTRYDIWFPCVSKQQRGAGRYAVAPISGWIEPLSKRCAGLPPLQNTPLRNTMCFCRSTRDVRSGRVRSETGMRKLCGWCHDDCSKPLSEVALIPELRASVGFGYPEDGSRH